VPGASSSIAACDMVAFQDAIIAAWVTEAMTIHVSFYREHPLGLEKIAEKTLTTPPDRGGIDGIDFFYDRAGGRVILGVLHLLNGHTGVSYFTLQGL